MEGLVQGHNIFKVTLFMTAEQQKIQTGFHLRDTGINNETPETAVNAVLPWVTGAYRNTIGGDVSIDRLDAIEITSREYFAHEFTNTPGTGGNAMTTSLLAALVSLRSSKRSRWRNGRMFWPLQGAPVNGLITGSNLTGLTTAADDLADRFIGSQLLKNFLLVVVAQARIQKQTRPAIEHSWIDVDTIRVSNIATALHRRKIGVGA